MIEHLPSGGYRLSVTADEHDARDIRDAVLIRLKLHEGDENYTLPDATHDDADPFARALGEICRAWIDNLVEPIQ